MGCYYHGYCSDMTRTVFYKKVSDEQRRVYELVKKANEAAEGMINFCIFDHSNEIYTL